MWQLPKVEPPHGAITPWVAHPDISLKQNLIERTLDRTNRPRSNEQQEQIHSVPLPTHLLLGGDYGDPSKKKNWVPD